MPRKIQSPRSDFFNLSEELPEVAMFYLKLSTAVFVIRIFIKSVTNGKIHINRWCRAMKLLVGLRALAVR